MAVETSWPVIEPLVAATTAENNLLGPKTATAIRRILPSAFGTDGGYDINISLIELLAFHARHAAHVLAVFEAQFPLLELFEEYSMASSNILVGSSDAFEGDIERTQNGWIIRGAWSFCSAASIADVFVLRVNDQARELGQTTRCFLVERRQVQAHDQRLLGLEGSGIQRLSVTELELREDRSSMFPYVSFKGGLAESLSRGLLGWCVGTARRLLMECGQAYKGQLRRAWRERRSVSEELTSALSEACELASRLAKRASPEIPSPWTNFLARAQAAHAIVLLADSIFLELGGEVLQPTSALQAIWRDLHTMQKHSLFDITRSHSSSCEQCLSPSRKQNFGKKSAEVMR